MKLEVGDIKMDSEAGISFTTSQQTLPTTTKPPEQTLEASERSTLTARRALLTALVIGGALMSMLTLLVALGELPLLLLIGWGLIAMLAFAVVTGRKRSEDHAPTSPPREHGVERERARRLLRLLDTSSLMDVRTLTEATGWSEEAVLTGLVFLLERELVEEDVDLETGHFCYARSQHVRFDFEEREALAPASERLAALRTSKP